MFDSTPDDLDMHVVYDVSHNIAKVSTHPRRGTGRFRREPYSTDRFAQVEEHLVDGRLRTLLVHRKARVGSDAYTIQCVFSPWQSCLTLYVCWTRVYWAQGSTRAFPPHHPLIPVDYQFTGQPVMIGGTMVCASGCASLTNSTESALAPPGHMQLRPDWNGERHAGDFWQARARHVAAWQKVLLSQRRCSSLTVCFCMQTHAARATVRAEPEAETTLVTSWSTRCGVSDSEPSSRAP